MLMSISDIGRAAIGTDHGWLLPALLVLCLAVIAVLAAFIVRQRRLIRRKNEYIVRYVGQYLSLKYDEFPELNKWQEVELTQMEQIKIMHLLKKMLCGCVLLLPALPAVAQDRTGTTYAFSFVPTDDMLYVPFGDNGSEQERQETCFITKSHAGNGDYATVRLTIPKDGISPVAGCDKTEPVIAERTDKPDNVPVNKEKETSAEGPQAQTVQAEQPATTGPMQTSGSLPTGEVGGAGASLSLRANLLRWATLTPDLGFEWRVSRLWSILVHGSWTSWSWNDKDRRYALWEVAPEVRYYIGKEKRGYLGAMYKAGSFNYKLSAVGKQGDLMGGGITGGYRLRLNNALSMDFNVGIGCLHADYDKYTVIDGVRVRGGKESKNWWGPINAGVTLVWRMVK